MPTRYWLVGPTEVLAVSRLEAAGGVRRAEADVDPAALADAHRRYAAERDAALGAADGPAPSGGVGGTREGVKCLHAHYAWLLAGGDDPVGRWVAARLAARLDVDDRAVVDGAQPRRARPPAARSVRRRCSPTSSPTPTRRRRRS